MTAASTLRQYAAVTGAYWAFTITDGALRMLVLLYFYTRGYSALEVASLFLLYEFFGIVTNLFGGWLGARIGLARALHLGMLLQVVALLMLTAPEAWLTVPYVMVSQALSGIAKDLSKTSAKSSVKLLVPDSDQAGLFKWIAVLTGSKNALKGLGYFLGSIMLAAFGLAGSVLLMAAAIFATLLVMLFLLPGQLGKSTYRPKFSHVFSKSAAINILSAARLFLFAARDTWFVIALPVYLQAELGWSFASVGGFLALWIIGYGLVQSLTPGLLKAREQGASRGLAELLAFALAVAMFGLAASLHTSIEAGTALMVGLAIFGVIFALNSSFHSYLVVSLARRDGVSLDVGFYYMANAAGRLLGTVLSGALYQWQGLNACLLAAGTLALASAFVVRWLPAGNKETRLHE